MVEWLRSNLLLFSAAFCIITLAGPLACASSQRPEAAAGERSAGEVDVRSLESETVITLPGLGANAYSSYLIDEENLLVLEIAGVGRPAASLFGELSSADGRLAVYDGLVDQVSTATYEDDRTPIKRVEIAFARDVDHEVVAEQEALIIRVRPISPPLQIEAATLAGTPAVGLGPDGAGAESVSETIEEDREAPATIVIDRPAAIRRPASAARSLTVTKLAGGVLLHLQADGMITAVEDFVLESPPRLVIDLPGTRNELMESAYPVNSEWVARVRVGSHPGKTRLVLDAGGSAAGFGARRIVPAADGLYLTVGGGADLDAALAAGVARSDSAPAGPR